MRFSFQVTLRAELRCVVRFCNFSAVSLLSLGLYLVTCGIRIIWGLDIDYLLACSLVLRIYLALKKKPYD